MRSIIDISYSSWTIAIRDLAGLILLWTLAFVGYKVGIAWLLDTVPNYSDDYVLTSIWFVGFSLITAVLYYKQTAYIVQSHFKPRELLLFAGFFVLVYGIVIHCAPTLAATSLAAMYPQAYFLQAGAGYVLAKSAEILFQQVLIVITVWTIARVTGSVVAVSLFFAIVFFLGHVLLILFLPLTFVALFATASLVAAASFPWLILRLQHGFLYTYMLHWLFYLVLIAGVCLWLV